jgi:hypothetical protein
MFDRNEEDLYFDIDDSVLERAFFALGTKAEAEKCRSLYAEIAAMYSAGDFEYRVRELTREEYNGACLDLDDCEAFAEPMCVVIEGLEMKLHEHWREAKYELEGEITELVASIGDIEDDLDEKRAKVALLASKLEACSSPAA